MRSTTKIAVKTIAEHRRKAEEAIERVVSVAINDLQDDHGIIVDSVNISLSFIRSFGEQPPKSIVTRVEVGLAVPRKGVDF